MKPLARPELVRAHGGTLLLSGPALAELLRAVLSRGASLRFRTEGYSMGPFIRNGDVITVGPLRPGLPPRGDIVACADAGDGRVRVHRVIARRRDALLIKGDNAPRPDGLVPVDRVLGRVLRVERAGRPVRCGIVGPERVLIAWLSRWGWLQGLLAPVRWAARQVGT